MAVSGTAVFGLNASQIVEEARRVAGIHAAEEPMDASELAAGLNALNMMLKTWQTRGVPTWITTEGSLALTQAQAGYAFGPGGDFTTTPVSIDDARINRGTNDLPMFRLSREEYYALPNKATQGYPTQWYYDRQRNGGTFFVWPAPDAAAGTLKFTYRRPIMDMTAADDDMDLPQEWTEAVVAGLAARLLQRYGMSGSPDAQLVIAEAERSFNILAAFDTAQGGGSVTIRPAR